MEQNVEVYQMPIRQIFQKIISIKATILLLSKIRFLRDIMYFLRIRIARLKNSLFRIVRFQNKQLQQSSNPLVCAPHLGNNKPPCFSEQMVLFLASQIHPSYQIPFLCNTFYIIKIQFLIGCVEQSFVLEEMSLNQAALKNDKKNNLEIEFFYQYTDFCIVHCC